MRVRRRWLLSAFGLALVVGLLTVARPAVIAERLAGVTFLSLVRAFGWAAFIAAARALRLALLVGRPLGPLKAFGVVAATQAGISVLPFRLGELVLLPLLHRAGVLGTVRGLSFLVVLRAMDIAALVTWAVVLAIATGVRLGTGAAVLAALLSAGFLFVLLGLRLVSRLARSWRCRTDWRRRSLGQVLMVRRELRLRTGTPLQLALLSGLSLAVWAGIWGQTLALVRGMGIEWPATAVLGGVIGSAVSSALPVTTIGSFGTLEAGWALALAAAGVGTSEALAVGFATHLWSVVFTIMLAILGTPALLRRGLRISRANDPEKAARAITGPSAR